MKKRIFILCACCMALFSCGNSNDEISNYENEANNETVLKTELSSSVVESVVDKIDDVMSKEMSTRTVGGVGYVISEEEAKELLAPFVEEGKRLREKVLADMRDNPRDYPAGAGIELLNMTDDQLAEFGYTVYEYDTNPKLVMYGTAPWVSCIGDALGIGRDLYKYISGTKQLLTARTTFMIAKSFLKRTLGWVGVAYGIYEYTKCMNGK